MSGLKNNEIINKYNKFFISSSQILTLNRFKYLKIKCLLHIIILRPTCRIF